MSNQRLESLEVVSIAPNDYDRISAEDEHQEDVDASHFLECGPSLTEAEHNDDTMPNPISLSFEEPWNSISLLRNSLADDIVGNTLSARNSSSSLPTTVPLVTFTSPWEVPSSKRNVTSSYTTNHHTKFLQVPLVYCDQTASNRPLNSIEQYINQVCLPLYGNTHTNTSITGSQSTAFCAEARQIVAEATNAKITGKASLDIVLFAGNGTTSAVELLIDCMGLRSPHISPDQSPVVFVGPYEHHSNLLPWRESGCHIVMVPECPKTFQVDMNALERLLKDSAYDGRVKIGTFSAASNVTGKVSDVDAIAALLHSHGALAFFDYATGAPYLPINMNPAPTPNYPSASLVAKDAIYFSPHKLVGGVGTPGVLIVKKHLVHQVNPPSKSGGGTVFYVTSTHHRFLSNRIERYEGGTPNVPGILRTGLAFLLKRQVERRYAQLAPDSHKSLIQFEFQTYNTVARTLIERAPNLVLLGDASPRTPHLPIFSFLIRCGKRFLHYNFVCALLNDVFGIQSRGGCQCSGPYSQRLLGLTLPDIDKPNDTNEKLEYALVHFKERAELLRPGFTRISLPFKGLRDIEVDYVVNALVWIAKFGWMMMPQYRCNHRTGEWRHHHRQGKPLGKTERKWLSHFDMAIPPPTDFKSGDTSVSGILQEARENADGLLDDAKADQRSISQALKMNEASETSCEDDVLLEELRWFVYPKECAVWLTQGEVIPPETDSVDILGALKPRAVSMPNLELSITESWLAATTLQSPVFLQNSNKRDEISRKRKNIVESQTPEKSTISQGLPSPSIVLIFRDGEHTGEASFQEIETGFEDGELSEHCQIFDSVSDSWTRISDFLRSKPMNGQEGGESSGGMMIKVKAKQIMTSMQDEKNQKKKPARDSSQWGKKELTMVDIAQMKESTVVSNVPTPNPTSLYAPIKQKRGKGVKPPPKLMRMITQAMVQWNMLENGDRLLLGLSGGKDSISLLHCLLEFQRKLPIKFEIEVCTIDPMTPSFDPSPLIPYVESLGLKYHYIRDDIVDRANKSGRDGNTVSSLCAFCARMKRGNLYTCARRNNCNKLVLAQHLDDCAESFLMSVMHNGFLRTMKANYKINAGDISVIRPMVYCRESLMTEFVKASNLPVINENCPACFEEPKERARVKKLLTREETLFPNFYDNIRRSLIPLMHEDTTAILRCYTEEAVARSRKENANPVKRLKNAEEKKDDSKVESSMYCSSTDSNTDEPHQLRKVLMLSEASENDLLMELARRRADRCRLSGSMKRLEDDMPEDPTGQVCSLNGGDGSIPCRELME
jgi:selenocysteine lyase/cysteine desulfurase/tRNA(Ile)-lysidine synthase TilS/MesJ